VHIYNKIATAHTGLLHIHSSDAILCFPFTHLRHPYCATVPSRRLDPPAGEQQDAPDITRLSAAVTSPALQQPGHRPAASMPPDCPIVDQQEQQSRCHLTADQQPDVAQPPTRSSTSPGHQPTEAHRPPAVDQDQNHTRYKKSSMSISMFI
jgi:hypothetical protein